MDDSLLFRCYAFNFSLHSFYTQFNSVSHSSLSFFSFSFFFLFIMDLAYRTITTITILSSIQFSLPLPSDCCILMGFFLFLLSNIRIRRRSITMS